MRAALAACALGILLAGCYAANQRTSYVTRTKAIGSGPSDPGADLSISADIYELVGGTTYKGVSLYVGMGLGAHRIHQRTSTQATEPDEIDFADRVSIGVSAPMIEVGPGYLRGFVVYAGSFSDLLTDTSDLEADGDIISTRITKSKEFGVEWWFPVKDPTDFHGFVMGPFIRLGGAFQEGKTITELYGDPVFESFGVLAAIGFGISTESFSD